VWAVGESSTVLRWDGQSWLVVGFNGVYGDPDVDEAWKWLHDVLVFAPDDVWVSAGFVDGSEGSVVFHWDGNEWSLMKERAEAYRLAGNSPDEVWVLGGYCCFSELSACSGDGWSVLSSMGTVEDFAVTEQGSAFAVGAGGTIFRYHGCRADDDCVDPDTCKTDRLCTDGLCVGGTPVAEASPCDDRVFCNGEDTCDANGKCSVHAGDPCGGLTCNEDEDVCQ
jgi:hypothetical protein